MSNSLSSIAPAASVASVAAINLHPANEASEASKKNEENKNEEIIRLKLENEKVKGHLQKVTQLARKNGFNGRSGAELLEFIDQRFLKAEENSKQLAEVLRALQHLEPDASLNSAARVIRANAQQIKAQRATIEVLTAPHASPVPRVANTPLVFRN